MIRRHNHYHLYCRYPQCHHRYPFAFFITSKPTPSLAPSPRQQRRLQQAALTPATQSTHHSGSTGGAAVNPKRKSGPKVQNHNAICFCVWHSQRLPHRTMFWHSLALADRRRSFPPPPPSPKRVASGPQRVPGRPFGSRRPSNLLYLVVSC